MSIYIKGMKTPKKCFGCPMVSFIGTCNVNKNYLIKPLDEEGKHPECPVVKISTPHGRLIDADKLMIAVLKAMNSEEDISVIGLIDRAPTIIEAEDTER